LKYFVRLKKKLKEKKADFKYELFSVIDLEKFVYADSITNFYCAANKALCLNMGTFHLENQR